MKVSDTIGKRVKRARLRADLSQAALAAAAGCTQPTISSIEKDQVTRPDHLIEIAAALNVSPKWLLDGSDPPPWVHAGNGAGAGAGAGAGENLPARQPAAILPPSTLTRISGVQVPLMNPRSPEVAEALGAMTIPLDMLGYVRVPPESAAFVEVVGDAMEPILHPGDIVMIDRGQTHPAQPGLFAVWLDAVVVRRLELVRDADSPMVRVLTANPAYQDSVMPADRIEILGRYVGRFTTR